MLQAGETLAGYRIEAIAGVGGMGVVYRATQLSLERRVALKVLSTTLVGNHRFRERFRQEGRHAAALDHPNIIPVYEAGESNGLMFIAMRFVDGPTLADMIVQEALTGRETLRILGAIASALDAANESGLIHRDVKPHNILLTSGGHPYLADFGITKGAQGTGLTNSGDFVGSVSYVSPEQIDGREVTRASDIYSLTAVLFHCLTGSLPFDQDTEAALMHAHLYAMPPTISGLGIDVPRALDNVFTRGMAKDAAFRYESATELIDACRDALALAGAPLDRCPVLAPGTTFGPPAPQPPPILAPPPAIPAPPPAVPPPPPVPPAPPPPPVAAEPPPAAPAWTAAPVAGPPQAPAASAAVAAAADALDPALAPAGDPTAADRRREPPAAPGGPAAPGWWSWLGLPWEEMRLPVLVTAAALAILAAPLLGWALGQRDDAAAPEKVGSQSVEVAYRAPWTPSGATIAGLGVDGAVGLRRPDGTLLVAGRLRDPAPGFDPAPATLRAAAARDLEPARVRLGGRDAVRYAVPLRAGGSLWLVAFPDSRGWTAVACRSAQGRPDAACASVAGTLRAHGAEPVRLRPDPRTAAVLDRTIQTLSGARVAARPGLRSRSYVVRAGTHRRLARADAAAAGALARLELSPQERALFQTLGGELRAEATILRRLARATTGRLREAYNGARAALRAAERRVRAAERDLRAAGYARRS